jgi:hypothetical protein
MEGTGMAKELYGERAGRAYLITHVVGRAWVLRQRFLHDTNWEVVSEYNTKGEARAAAGI